MAKGIPFSPSNYRRVGSRSGSGASVGLQSTIHSYAQYPHVSRADVKDFLVPVLKEVGKVICPPAAVPIEILYQIYKHADAIKEVGSAVMKGDYGEAARVVTKEFVKEVGSATIGTAAEPVVAKGSNLAAESVTTNLPTNLQGKDLGGKIAKGTIKGAAEAATDKVVDKVVDKVMDDEKR